MFLVVAGLTAVVVSQVVRVLLSGRGP
jgi:hypothetical protein